MLTEAKAPYSLAWMTLNDSDFTHRFTLYRFSGALLLDQT